MNPDDLNVIIPTLKSDVEYPSFLKKHRIILSDSPGRGRARNDGAKKCSSKYLLFIDDDATFTEATYRKYILSPLMKNPDIVISMESNVLSTRVMAISRNLFFRLRGFDETFETAEDIDFGYRVLESGYRISYIPMELVIHREHPRPSRERNALKSYRNAIRFLHRYHRIILWEKKDRKAKVVKFSLLNVFRMFFDAPRKGIFTPMRITVSILGFYYYSLFDKKKILGDV